MDGRRRSRSAPDARRAPLRPSEPLASIALRTPASTAGNAGNDSTAGSGQHADSSITDNRRWPQLTARQDMAQYIYTMNRVSQGGPAQARHPARHQPVLLSGRQDRRAGPERRGQVHAAARSWPGIDQDIDGEARPQSGIRVGLSAAGAAARSRPRTCAATVMEGVGETFALLEDSTRSASGSPSPWTRRK